MPFAKYAFLLPIENPSIGSCPHYSFDAFSAFHTKTFENERIARCDVSWTLGKHMLQTHALAMFLFWCVFDHFWPSALITICMRSCFDPLSRAFSGRCLCDENTPRISVDERPKRIKCMRFQNALVWKGPPYSSAQCNRRLLNLFYYMGSISDLGGSGIDWIFIVCISWVNICPVWLQKSSSRDRLQLPFQAKTWMGPEHHWQYWRT